MNNPIDLKFNKRASDEAKVSIWASKVFMWILLIITLAFWKIIDIFIFLYTWIRPLFM